MRVSTWSLILALNAYSSIKSIIRLNSEDFSKFLLCWDIKFLTDSYESRHPEVQKSVEIFRIFLNIHEFSQHFRSFSFKTFLYSELQSPSRHHKIRHKIPHRTGFVRPRGSTGEKWFCIKNCPKMWFYAGWNCVGWLRII